MSDSGPARRDLVARFLRQADGQFREDAPFYGRLARGVAADPDLLALAALTRPDQDPPLMLLAAVHYLLLQDPREPLAAYYPSVVGAAALPGDPSPLFRAFCLRRRAAMRDPGDAAGADKRGSALREPAAGLRHGGPGRRRAAAGAAGACPSAGLNLLWDRYSYDYGPREAGDADLPVRLTVSRGAIGAALPRPLPRVASRAGVDLDPVDVRDPAAVLWLRALIWPGGEARAEQLERAVALAREDPPASWPGRARAAAAHARRDAAVDVDRLCVRQLRGRATQPRAARSTAGAAGGRECEAGSESPLIGRARPSPASRRPASRAARPGRRRCSPTRTRTGAGWSGWRRVHRLAAGRGGFDRAKGAMLDRPAPRWWVADTQRRVLRWQT